MAFTKKYCVACLAEIQLADKLCKFCHVEQPLWATAETVPREHSTSNSSIFTPVGWVIVIAAVSGVLFTQINGRDEKTKPEYGAVTTSNAAERNLDPPRDSAQDEREVRELAELDRLKKSDIDGYLQLLHWRSDAQWQEEIKTLRPKEYATYKAKEAAQLEAVPQLKPTDSEFTQIQRMLKAGGFFTSQVDGIWGPETEAAISRWHAFYGRPPTKMLSAAEIEALKKGAPPPQLTRDEREQIANENREAAELKALREKNVDDYLKRLHELHPAQWEQELRTLRPQQYATYKAQEAAQQETTFQEAYRKNPISGLTLTHDWYFGGFGNVMIANFTIKSLLAFPVKDIKIACHTSAASGTGLSLVVQTIYQIVPAKSTVRFSNVNMGLINSQSTNAGCDFVGVNQ